MHRLIRSSFATLLAAGSLAGGAIAFAQGAMAPPAGGTDPAIQRELASCDGVMQDKAACLRERGAARQESQRGGLTSASTNGYDQNAMERCRLQPPSDRADCEKRVMGTGRTTYEGSVLGGGVIRETVTPVPAPAVAR